MNLAKLIAEMQQKGYKPDMAAARICQDIVLKSISQSRLSENVTVKGGVVMRSITNNVRRSTLDLDIDFIRYSLSDDSIDRFIAEMKCPAGISIERVGEIQELSQQDYKGKRVYVQITDDNGNTVDSKIDFGVHRHLDVEQEDYCFDIAFDDEGASLLINTQEQMFTEKLRSLLKFGTFSTRYKDIYDMYYQCGKLNKERLKHCFNTFIFNDKGMRENNMSDIISRIEFVFNDEIYKGRVDKSDKRWLDEDIDVIFNEIKKYIRCLL